MEIKQTHGKLHITDNEGMEIRLEPVEVAELIGYLNIKVRT